ncbi:MAG: hypothetical protein QXI36_02085 [Candidatus Bathyarchaeia archaeon]
MTKAFDTALAMIQAEEMSKHIAERIVVEVKPELKSSTYVDRRSNITLPIILFDEKGSGTLKELVLKSSVNTYKVIITADGYELYNNDWNWFYSMSQVVKEIAAFQENSTYILSIADLKFTRSLRISLRATETGVTLTESFLKVDIAKERIA